jgi:hypothetical protein
VRNIHERVPHDIGTGHRQCTSIYRLNAATALSERRASMPESHTPRTPQRRVRVYERLTGAGGSPAKTIGIVVVLLIILIAIIMALT